MDKVQQLISLFKEETDRMEEQKALVSLLRAQIRQLLDINLRDTAEESLYFLPDTHWGLVPGLLGPKVYYRAGRLIYLAPKDIRLYRNQEYGLVGWATVGVYFYIFRQSNQIPDSDIAKFLGAGQIRIWEG
jgi:hypothetical protein